MRIVALEVGIDDGRILPMSGLATAEAARLWELVQAGIVRETYFRSDRREAVLMLECASLDEARSHLGTLPFVQEGLIGFELIGLRPYPGFARLFADRTASPAH